MKPSASVLSGAVIGALLAFMTLLLAAGSVQASEGDRATDQWPVLPPEAEAFHRQELAERVAAEIAGEPELYGFDSPLTGITVGPLYPVYLYTRAFVRGRAAADRGAAFQEDGTWIAPVLQHGVVRNAVTIDDPTGAGWDFGTFGYGADVGRRMSQVQPGDLVVIEPPLQAWFRVQDAMVSPLNAAADRVLARPASLAAFGRQLADRYAGSNMDPAGVMVGGDSTPPHVNRRTTSPLLIGAALVAVTGLVVALRRSHGRSRA